MSDCKTVKTPVDSKTKFVAKENVDLIADIYPCQEVIGCICHREPAQISHML